MNLKIINKIETKHIVNRLIQEQQTFEISKGLSGVSIKTADCVFIEKFELFRKDKEGKKRRKVYNELVENASKLSAKDRSKYDDFIYPLNGYKKFDQVFDIVEIDLNRAYESVAKKFDFISDGDYTKFDVLFGIGLTRTKTRNIKYANGERVELDIIENENAFIGKIIAGYVNSVMLECMKIDDVYAYYTDAIYCSTKVKDKVIDILQNNDLDFKIKELKSIKSKDNVLTITSKDGVKKISCTKTSDN